MSSMNEYLGAIEKEFILMPTWKWMLLILFLLLFPFLRKTAEIFIGRLKRNLSSLISKNQSLSYFLPFKLEQPLSWILVLLAFMLFVDVLDFHVQIKKYTLLVSQILLAIRVIQFVYITIDGFGSLLKDTVFKSDTENQIQIIPFFIKTMKVLIVILGILITLQNLGFNVVSLLAGLGLGGLAIALAAQETVANLFGSITILFDKPFKMGDHIKLQDIEGTIEEIGFRSTKIRTFSNTTVSLPNAIVAKEKIENFTERYQRRIRQVLGVTYETSPDQLLLFIKEIEALLKKSPYTVEDTITVKLNHLGASSLDILVNFFIKIQTPADEAEIQQKTLLEILKLAADMKINFAYPTQRVYSSQI